MKNQRFGPRDQTVNPVNGRMRSFFVKNVLFLPQAESTLVVVDGATDSLRLLKLVFFQFSSDFYRS